MSIHDIIEGKKKWRAHVARVKALPPDYQIVYKEVQKFLFKVGPVDLGTQLSGIVDFFEEGAASGKGITELIGTDVGALNRPGLCGGSDSPKDDDHASIKEVSAGVAGSGRSARL
jgi:DNA-binding ferritin-like protein (Dps family)